MAAGVYNFTIEQGATLNKQFALKNPDNSTPNLTGYTAQMMLRVAVADSDVPTPVLLLSTANGRISLGGVAGTITLALSAATTQALPVPSTADKKYLYDLELTDGSGNVARILKGEVAVDQEVTR